MQFICEWRAFFFMQGSYYAGFGRLISKSLKGRMRLIVETFALCLFVIVAACEKRPSFQSPPNGTEISADELLLRLQWLSQLERLRDRDAVLRVTGGRFGDPRRSSTSYGNYHIENTEIPAAYSTVTYTIGGVNPTGVERPGYSLIVPLDTRRVCVTTDDMRRILGESYVPGLPPVAVRGGLSREQPLVSASYAYPQENGFVTQVWVRFLYARCADFVGVALVKKS
jgi:hypothetical protein